MAKEFLSRKGVEYVERNVAQDQQARQDMVNKTGQYGVPVIVVDDEAIVGFDQAKLEKVLH